MSPRTKKQYAQIRQARREQILTAARQAFAEHGFHSTKMSDIAQAIDVSQGTLYHYFRSKDDLFMAMFSAWAERLEEAMTALPDAPMGATEKLWMMNRVAIDFLRNDEALLPVFVEFCAYALRNPRAADSFRALFQAMQTSLARIIDEGVASGEFKPIDSGTLSALPLVILDGTVLVSLIVGKDVVDPEQIVQQAQRLVLDGLLVKPEDARQ